MHRTHKVRHENDDSLVAVRQHGGILIRDRSSRAIALLSRFHGRLPGLFVL